MIAFREGEDGNNGDNVGGEDDFEGGGDDRYGVDEGGDQVDIVVLGQQAGNLGAALVYVDHLPSHQNIKNIPQSLIHSWCMHLY